MGSSQPATTRPAARRPRPAPLLQTQVRLGGHSRRPSSLGGWNPGHAQMFTFSRVPFGGRKGYGQPFQRTVKFFESAVAPDVAPSRFRVYGCDANPTVANQLIQPPVGLDHAVQSFRSGLDNE